MIGQNESLEYGKVLLLLLYRNLLNSSTSPIVIASRLAELISIHSSVREMCRVYAKYISISKYIGLTCQIWKKARLCPCTPHTLDDPESGTFLIRFYKSVYIIGGIIFKW